MPHVQSVHDSCTECTSGMYKVYTIHVQNAKDMNYPPILLLLKNGGILIDGERMSYFALISRSRRSAWPHLSIMKST